MRILFVAPIDEFHALRWIRYFAERQQDVHVVYAAAPKKMSMQDVERQVNGAKLHFLDLGKKRSSLISEYFDRFVPFIKKTKQLIADINPDLIHAHWIDIAAYSVARSGFHPFVATAWASDIRVNAQKSAKDRFIVRQVLKKADIITCDGKQLIEEAIRMGATRDRVSLACFGTDINQFNPGNRDRSFAGDLGFQPETKLVISLRRLYNPIYDIPTFVRSVPLVLEKLPNTGFIIVGDGPEKQMLQDLSKSLGVGEKIRFVGTLADDELRRYVASADVYVSTALSDSGLSASTAEAMASEVPVVITDVVDNRDWIEDGKNGLLFEGKAHAMLAEKIVYLLDNPVLSKELGQEGRTVISERLNYHIELEKVEKMYTALVSENARR